MVIDAAKGVEDRTRKLMEVTRLRDTLFGEVFVPRGIQQVHQTVMIRELHYRGGDRNTTLLDHHHRKGAAVRTGDSDRRYRKRPWLQPAREIRLES
jgi:hypothetical protein